MTAPALPAPYPPDTRAKGWRFELDYEQIEQSDTWDLAGPEGRPWLLMMWFAAWRQVPCGSLPGDEQVIAAKLGMPPKAWAKHRAVLLRGWSLADDGRMYHVTMTQRVIEMMTRRRSDSDRQAARRRREAEEAARQAAESRADPPELTPVSRVTPTGVRPESSTDHRPPNTGEEKEKAARKRAAPPPDRPDGVDPQTWADWLALRKSKAAPVTPTVLAGAAAEAGKAGMTLDAFLRVWCTRGSQGLQADWLRPHERQAPAAPNEAPWRAEQRERNVAFAGPAAAKPRQPSTVVTEETPHAARLVG